MKITPEQENKIRRFITAVPNLDDSVFHAFVESIGAEPHDAEEAVYKFVRELQGTGVNPGGKADQKGITVKDVDKEQLEVGKEVEKEHGAAGVKTPSGIAMDHLSEDNEYYRHLLAMERKYKS